MVTLKQQRYNCFNYYYPIANYKYNFNYLLIGYGNIGYRHLQAILNCNIKNINIFVIDINMKNINNKIKGNNIYYTDDLKMIKEDYFDIVTIATCSNNRKQILNDIMKYKYFNKIVLEKVVFQKLDDFVDIYENKNIFVNSHYNKQFQIDFIDNFKNPKININIDKKWGICCNLVHLMHYFLFNFPNLDLKLQHFENIQIDNSKRNGFKEFSNGKLYNDNLTIIIENDLDYLLNINYIENDKILNIKLLKNETIEFYYKNNDKILKKVKNVLYTSTFLMKEYNNLLTNQPTEMFDLKTSYQCHKMFFPLFSKIFNNTIIPIT